jgi:hypothetical protein
MRLRAVTVMDRYVGTDGRSVLLVGHRVVLLSEIATALLEALGDVWTDLVAVAAVLEDRFGAPDGTSVIAATDGVARQLAEQGLVQIDLGS